MKSKSDTDTDQDQLDTVEQDPKPPGENTEVQPKPASETPAAAGNDDEDLEDDEDPLLKARKPTATTDKPAEKKAPETPAKDKDGKAAPAQPEAKDKDEAKRPEKADKEPKPALSAEAWAKLNHSDRQVFLRTRSEAARQRDEAAKERTRAETLAKEAKEAKDYSGAIEKFVADQGLNPEEYQNGVVIAGLVKRSDERAIPVLEKTLRDLRKARGIAELTPEPVAPAIDLDAIAKALADFNLAEAQTLVAAAIAKRAAVPPKPAAPAPVAPAQPIQQQPPSMTADEVRANSSCVDYLRAEGVAADEATAAAYITSMVKAGKISADMGRPENAGKRLKAVMDAHRAATAPPRSQQPPTPPSQTPISGRSAGRAAAPSRPQNEDPLIAVRRPKRA